MSGASTPAERSQIRRLRCVVLLITAAVLTVVLRPVFYPNGVSRAQAREDERLAADAEAVVRRFLTDLPAKLQTLTYDNADGTLRKQPNSSFGAEVEAARQELFLVQLHQQFGDFVSIEGSGSTRTDAFDLLAVDAPRVVTFQRGTRAILIDIRYGGTIRVEFVVDSDQNHTLFRVSHPALISR